MEKFFVAIAVQGLDLEMMNSKKGLNFGNDKSGKCSSLAEAERWAEAQVAKGQRCTYVIFEAISAVKPKEQPYVKEELKLPALQDFSEAAE